MHTSHPDGEASRYDVSNLQLKSMKWLIAYGRYGLGLHRWFRRVPQATAEPHHHHRPAIAKAPPTPAFPAYPSPGNVPTTSASQNLRGTTCTRTLKPLLSSSGNNVSTSHAIRRSYVDQRKLRPTHFRTDKVTFKLAILENHHSRHIPGAQLRKQSLKQFKSEPIVISSSSFVCLVQPPAAIAERSP